jgi:hypothetical protein
MTVMTILTMKCPSILRRRWTLLIEALEPLLVRLPTGNIHMRPGQPIRFAEEVGSKLLAKAPEKVKLIPEVPPEVGMVVEWDSPLFGFLAGVILTLNSQTVTVAHPLTETEATIPRTWLTGRTR